MLLAVEAAFHIKSFVQKLHHILGLAVNQVVAICTTEEVSVTSLVSFTLTSHPNLRKLQASHARYQIAAVLFSV